MSKIVVGKKVPDFTCESTSGDKFALKNIRGKNLILYFYPKDNTPGCTNESNDFKEQYKKIKKLNTEVFGISRDTLASHERFKTKYDFPFDLLSDPDEKVCKLFDVMKQKNMFGKKVWGIERSTFLIDADGVLQHQWRKVKVPDHVDDVINALKKMKS